MKRIRDSYLLSEEQKQSLSEILPFCTQSQLQQLYQLLEKYDKNEKDIQEEFLAQLFLKDKDQKFTSQVKEFFRNQKRKLLRAREEDADTQDEFAEEALLDELENL